MKMKATIKNAFAALVLPACAALALLGSTATSQAAAFMKLGDIKGESSDTDHKDWIIIESMSSAIFRSVPEGANDAQRTRGETTLGDIVVTRELDKSSTKIQEAVCPGTIFPEVEIVLTKDFALADGTSHRIPYLTYKLKDVIITSYSFQGSAAGDRVPTEQITLGYTGAEWTYVVVDPKTGNSETVIGVCAPSSRRGKR